MKAESIPTPCPGFASTTMTIEITYVVPEGKHQRYHEYPGAKFGYTRRKAYLPDNEEGLLLLSRMKYAFMRGLIFYVGTSQTTGKASSVVWSTIRHKTSLNGGPFGFPDTGFIFDCNDSLDALGVPEAGSLHGDV
jgi:deltex-like protein